MSKGEVDAVYEPKTLLPAPILQLESGTQHVVVEIATVRKVLIAVCMMLVYFLGGSVALSIILALPSIERDLHLSTAQVQWIPSASSLSFPALMESLLLISGRLADLFGRKLFFLMGMAIFVVFSILSGVVKNYVGLCVIRALAGCGQALATPAAFGIIGVTFREEPSRTIAFAAFNLGNPIGAIVGQVLGGVMSGATAWSNLFYVHAGIGAIPLVLGFLVIPRDVPGRLREGEDRRIDWIGAFLATSGVTLLLFSLGQSQLVSKGFKEPYIGAVLALSIVLIGAFLLWQHLIEKHSTRPPVAKLSLFTRQRGKLTSVLFVVFLTVTAVSGYTVSVTLWYQNLLGYSPIQTALRVVPAAVMGMVACLMVMFLVRRIPALYMIGSGLALCGVSNLLYAICPPGGTYWTYQFFAQIMFPFGIDFMIGIGGIIASNMVAAEEQSVVGALFNTFSSIGMAFGLCFATLVSTEIQRTLQDMSQHDMLLKGLRSSFWGCAGCAWGACLIACWTLRHVGIVGKEKLVMDDSKAGEATEGSVHP